MGRSGRPSRGVLSPPSPSYRPVPQEVTQPQRQGLRWLLTKLAGRCGEEGRSAQGLEAGLPGATPTSGKPPPPPPPGVQAPPPRATVCPQSSFSKPPWAPLKLSPILSRSLPAPSPSTFVGEKKLKAAVSGWDGGGAPCRCPAVPRASGSSKGDRSLPQQGEGFAGRGNLVCKDGSGEGAFMEGGQEGERAPAQVCRSQRSG